LGEDVAVAVAVTVLALADGLLIVGLDDGLVDELEQADAPPSARAATAATDKDRASIGCEVMTQDSPKRGEMSTLLAACRDQLHPQPPTRQR
jgi:hypothetical protein